MRLRISCGLLLPIVVALGAGAASAWSWQAQSEVRNASELDAGFHLLYDLRPQEARAQFAVWQAAHPDDAMGNASEAASYLFEECYRQGVLTSEYFFDNKLFLGKIAIKPDREIRDAFFATDLRAQDLARLRLKIDPEVNALFAMTLSLGMQADYASLIEKHQLESLAMIREADGFAKQLLAINPDAADAYPTLGAANYIIGSLPALKRFLLHFKGISGDKRVGLQQLQIAATRGLCLRPFAKILLALAALRQKKPEVARVQLMDLVAEFPQNPLLPESSPNLRPLLTPQSHLNSSAARVVPAGMEKSALLVNLLGQLTIYD